MTQQILLDHPLSYALTAIADVPVVYLQQFWQTVHKVPNTKDIIIFKLDTQEITYTVDMFRAILKLPVETPDNPFLAPVTIEIIKSFMNKKKEAIQYPRFIKLVIADLMNKFPDIPQRVDENYHSIKYDTPLVSMYTPGNVLVRGMLIPDAFLTGEIYTTDDFKEYETVFVGVDVPMNQPQPVVSTQGTHRSTPRAYRTHTVSTASPQGKKRKQTAGESKKVDEEKDVDMGSLETMTEEMQTPIPTPHRSPRINLSLDKNITRELTDIVPIPTTTTSKTLHSKRCISSKYSNLPATYDLIQYNLKPSIAATIIEDRDAFRSEYACIGLTPPIHAACLEKLSSSTPF
uniref:Uncharacterized protein n=1 Tax=Tanacetum cinerariifolium TaxID=118510 RepID=A0A699HPK7_TANCI|nr:hypothetical protein [Tanacetum cinerariifolium]